MDAVPFVISAKGPDVTKPKLQYDMLRRFRELLQWRQGDAIILGEANVLPKTDMEYFGEAGERLHMMFNFQVNQYLFYALATADSRPLIQALEKTKPRPTSSRWVMIFGFPNATALAHRCNGPTSRTAGLRSPISQSCR